MTRGAGSYHFALREKIKGFETLKAIRDKGLVYEWPPALIIQLSGAPRRDGFHPGIPRR